MDNPDTRATPSPFTLLASVMADDCEPLRYLLRAGADANGWVSVEGTPLARAAGLGRPSHVALLLAAGAHPQSCDHEGVDALSLAAVSGSVECCELLIAAGAALDGSLGLSQADKHPYPFMRQGAGPTPPWYPHPRNPALEAATHGHGDVLRLLFAMGAHTDFQDKAAGITPLVAAIRAGHPDAISACLDGGADPNLPSSSNGSRPGSFALESSRACMAALRAAPAFDPKALHSKPFLISPANNKITILDAAKLLPGTPAADDLLAWHLSNTERGEMQSILPDACPALAAKARL